MPVRNGPMRRWSSVMLIVPHGCEQASNPPGYTSVRPNSAATVAEVLKLNAYNHYPVGWAHAITCGSTWDRTAQAYL